MAEPGMGQYTPERKARDQERSLAMKEAGRLGRQLPDMPFQDRLELAEYLEQVAKRLRTECKEKE